MTTLSSLGNSPLDDLYKNLGGVDASRAVLRKKGQVPLSPYLRLGARSLAGAGGSGPGAAARPLVSAAPPPAAPAARAEPARRSQGIGSLWQPSEVSAA